MKSSGFAKTYDAPLSKNRFTSSSHSSHCILRKMDDDMPIMTGPQAAFELRKNLKFEGILCGVSGNTLEEDVKRWNVVEKSVME